MGTVGVVPGAIQDGENTVSHMNHCRRIRGCDIGLAAVMWNVLFSATACVCMCACLYVYKYESKACLNVGGVVKYK